MRHVTGSHPNIQNRSHLHQEQINCGRHIPLLLLPPCRMHIMTATFEFIMCCFLDTEKAYRAPVLISFACTNRTCLNRIGIGMKAVPQAALWPYSASSQTPLVLYYGIKASYVLWPLNWSGAQFLISGDKKEKRNGRDHKSQLPQKPP